MDLLVKMGEGGLKRNEAVFLTRIYRCLRFEWVVLQVGTVVEVGLDGLGEGSAEGLTEVGKATNGSLIHLGGVRRGARNEIQMVGVCGEVFGGSRKEAIDSAAVGDGLEAENEVGLRQEDMRGLGGAFAGDIGHQQGGVEAVRSREDFLTGAILVLDVVVHDEVVEGGEGAGGTYAVEQWQAFEIGLQQVCDLLVDHDLVL